ncbi:hypothetical protein CMI42_01890 [Candidatus Pacearchaeota archaeon]|nr:hypothetical protein [Candidatus Pacearchaeota archaeon]|tara:strand:+ start:2007 stop:2939 length:933 start_codon:yes stop_codon:yes gene_type:complete
MVEVPTYQHKLDDNHVLNAYSIDPSIGSQELESLVRDNDGIGNDPDKAKEISLVRKFDSFDDFDFVVVEGRYEVPEQLRAFREAIGKEYDNKGRYNGPVAIVDGSVELPLKLKQGGFYDYAATKLGAIPAELLPDSYPADKANGELFEEWGIPNDERAKYLGHAYLMLTNNGKELTLVQRAKGMAVAGDCMGVAGSTPNPNFSEHGFDYVNYVKGHVNDEMMEEFKLGPDDFSVSGIYLFNDKRNMPFCALEINTSLSGEDLASRIHGDPGAIKEHPVIYSIDSSYAREFVNRFPVFESIVSMLQSLGKN